MLCPSTVSKYVFYPVWDIWDGSNKLRELKDLQRSQWFDRSIIEDIQWKKFKVALSYAYKHSQYYRELFGRLGISPDDIQSRNDLGLIPITRKADIRNNLNAFISSKHQKNQLINAKTGGSTGFSLDLYFDGRCQEMRNAAAMRSDQWAGWDLGKVRGDLWGNPPIDTTFKQKVRKQLLERVFYLDTMQLNAQSMSEFFKLSHLQGVKVIFGHAHSIYIYASFLEDEGLSQNALDGVIATSMMLLDHERIVIERVFGCKVTNRYGCEEVGLIASECEQHKGLHINAEHVMVEFLREDGTVAEEHEVAKIIVTDLNNQGMPLLRYQVEDMGAYSNEACSCGRNLPLLTELSGRVADFLKTRSGDSVAGISLIERTLTDISGIEQMQIVQNSLNELVVNRVKAKDYSNETDRLLTGELQAVFGGETVITINDIDRIPQQDNGKYRFSICNL